MLLVYLDSNINVWRRPVQSSRLFTSLFSFELKPEESRRHRIHRTSYESEEHTAKSHINHAQVPSKLVSSAATSPLPKRKNIPNGNFKGYLCPPNGKNTFGQNLKGDTPLPRTENGPPSPES